jgi:3-methylcrotonyl-CoA carboxylase alpha subunit
MNGWAMEARLYAEDPANGFLPSIGKLEHFVLPDDIRVDTGVYEGGEVSQFYDPMIAKLIVHETSREAAAARLADACGEVEVWPVRTNAGFLKRCLEHPRFVSGDVDTGLIAAEEAVLTTPGQPSERAKAVAAIRLSPPDMVHDGWSPWAVYDNVGFRLNGARARGIRVLLNGVPTSVPYPDNADGVPDWAEIMGDDWVFFEGGDVFAFRRYAYTPGAAGGSASDGSLRAPMPGKIVAAPVKAGDAVVKGQPIVVLEAMKMEHALTAPFDGVVGEIGVAVGDQVAADAVLAVVKAEA